MKKFWFFIGSLLLLVGFQAHYTEKVCLTSQFTKALAEYRDPQVAKKQAWYEAIFGEPAKIPEKEVPIPENAGFGAMSLGTIFLLHGVFRRK